MIDLYPDKKVTRAELEYFLAQARTAMTGQGEARSLIEPYLYSRNGHLYVHVSNWLQDTYKNRNLSGLPLERIDLSYTNLDYVDFHRTELIGANFRGTSLRQANFKVAYLTATCFDNADLEGASLEGAQMSTASLINASLRGASLFRTRLFMAQLRGANLEDADMCEVDLQDASLEGILFKSSEGQRMPIELRHALLPEPEVV